MTYQMLERHILKNNKHSSVPFWWLKGYCIYNTELSAAPRLILAFFFPSQNLHTWTLLQAGMVGSVAQRFLGDLAPAGTVVWTVLGVRVGFWRYLWPACVDKCPHKEQQLLLKSSTERPLAAGAEVSTVFLFTSPHPSYLYIKSLLSSGSFFLRLCMSSDSGETSACDTIGPCTNGLTWNSAPAEHSTPAFHSL